MQQVLQVLNKFGDASGLRSNQLKSNVYFGGVSSEDKQAILEVTGMAAGELPFKYLGVPLSAQKLSAIQCQPLVRKILHKNGQLGFKVTVICWESSAH